MSDENSSIWIWIGLICLVGWFTGCEWFESEESKQRKVMIERIEDLTDEVNYLSNKLEKKSRY